jgi:PhzF family phenazine biosynthesis protein
MTTLRIFTVDAFTSTPYAGNPAAVCIVPEQLSLTDHQMLLIAKEMRHSETAFVQRDQTDQNNFTCNLRWFTPMVEVNLCGHATLATSHVLFSLQMESSEFPRFSQINFNTKSGVLIVTRTNDGYSMDFPAGNPQPVVFSDETKRGLAESLHFESSDITDVNFCDSTKKLVVTLGNVESIVKAKLESHKMMQVSYPVAVKGVKIVCHNLSNTQYSDYDFVSRYFNPWVGIDEDPVNGSGHTVLAVYYQRVLNKSKFKAYIASERTGSMGVELLPNNRVLLNGWAAMVLQGTINLPK